MSDRRSQRPRSQFSVVVRDALDGQSIGDMLAPAAVETARPAKVAPPPVEDLHVSAVAIVEEPVPANIDSLAAEVQRLQGEVDMLRARGHSRIAVRYEVPALIALAAVLVGIIVYQLARR